MKLLLTWKEWLGRCSKHGLAPLVCLRGSCEDTGCNMNFSFCWRKQTWKLLLCRTEWWQQDYMIITWWGTETTGSSPDGVQRLQDHHHPIVYREMTARIQDYHLMVYRRKGSKLSLGGTEPEINQGKAAACKASWKAPATEEQDQVRAITGQKTVCFQGSDRHMSPWLSPKKRDQKQLSGHSHLFTVCWQPWP